MNVSSFKIIARRVKENFPEKLSCLKLLVGGVPNKDFNQVIEKEAYDAVLIENVLHFLNEQQIQEVK